jgi:uncharacterized protein (DUF433 family)
MIERESQRASQSLGRLLYFLKQVHLNNANALQMNTLLNRISINPNICFGKPCIKGTRIWVSLILDLLAENITIEELTGDQYYPHLTREDILACIAYGAEMSRERFVEIPISATK